MSERWRKLRAMLSEAGTSEGWWRAVELVTGEGEGSSQLQAYLVALASEDPSWRGCMVPCGDWDAAHPGHWLCEVLSEASEVLEGATEIFCPPGTFLMSAGEPTARAPREVTLTQGFWAMSTLVTQAMVASALGVEPSCFEGPQHPLESLSWYDAVALCNKLSALRGFPPAYRFHGEGEVEWIRESVGVRLPTEAEWEYLCRAGSTSSTYGPLAEIAWNKDNSKRSGRRQTHPVGQKEANAWGFHDTLGNVWEWCFDAWSAGQEDTLPSRDPVFAPRHAERRVQRGGSWLSDTMETHAAYSDWDYATAAFQDCGIRLVRSHRFPSLR